jgi:Reverse transcriptase (RNA-dependent DNA polymerase)
VITLTLIIAEVFESILDICEVNLASDDWHFGFKRGSGCNDAIFALKMIINYFTTNKSTIFAAALCIHKAFDRVQHRKFIDSLYKAGTPDYVIAILVNWCAKLTAIVCWNNELSKSFAVRSGVRQCSVLSPSLFNVFINAIIVNVKWADTSCHIYCQFMGCLLYTDDIILLSPSFKGLQHMLDTCYNVSCGLELSFYSSKSDCICFDAPYKYGLEHIILGNEIINWVLRITYLGVHICGGRSLAFDLSATKQAFFS